MSGVGMLTRQQQAFSSVSGVFRDWGTRLRFLAGAVGILREGIEGGKAFAVQMHAPIKIGLPGQMPSIDDGMDADLDNDHNHKDSPSKRSRGPGQAPAGSASDEVPLTMSSLRTLLGEQCNTLLHAQKDQLHAALGDLEKRTMHHMQVIEAKVDSQQDQHQKLSQQVQAMAERVQLLENREGSLPGRGVDRKATLIFGGWQQQTRRATILDQLDRALQALGVTEFLDHQPFTTGPRRSVAMANFSLRPAEREGDPRQRMMKVLQAVNAGKVQLEGAAKTLWCSFSRTPAERGRAAVTAVVKKIVMRHCPTRQDDLDLDYAAGSAWVRDDQVSGMGPPPDECHRARIVETKAGSGWIDISTLAKWVETDKDVLNALVDEHRQVEKSDLVLLQELPRDKEGWDYQQLQGRRVIAHRAAEQWRGTGLWFDDRVWCVLRKVASHRGTWFKLRHLEHQLELWVGTAHFQPGCTHATFEEDVTQHFGSLPRSAHRVVFQGDVNTGFLWQVDDAGVTAYAKEGKGNTLHQIAVQQGMHFLPPRRDQLDVATSRPRQENREGQCIDVYLGKFASCRGVRVCEDSYMCLGTDHELVIGSFAFPGKKMHRRHDSCPRVLTKPIGQLDHIDQQVLAGLAVSHTKPSQGRSYKDPVEVKHAFREAKRRGTAVLWKEALKLRRQARLVWEKDRLRRASQGDWGSFKALKPCKQAGWDVAFAEVQTGDPHASVHQHLADVYAGPALQPEPPWKGEIKAFTTEELRVGLSQMKRGKAVGLDSTSTELLYGVMEAPGGEGHLLEYYNRILATQSIPQVWNDPSLIVLPKTHAPTVPRELRPIAMSSAVGKLFSRLLLNRALPSIRPSTYAQCAGVHRQTSDYLYTAFRTFELCREWGHPLAILKLDLEKAFDRLDRGALLEQLERRIGQGAELQCWKGLLSTTRGHLQTPWGDSVVEMNRGIKQGSVESPALFGHVTEVCLALAVDSDIWKAHPRVLEGMDAEEMLFVDDGLLWCRSCKGIEDRVQALVVELSKFGLKLNPAKCQLYVKNVEDGSSVRVQGTRVEAAAYMEVMGIKMYVGISIYELVAPLVARARSKFWELKHIFRCRSGMKARVKVMERVVGSTALWCLASFMPDAAAMSLLNSTQLQLMVWLLRFAKRADEPWDAYRQRAFRGARAALHSTGVERWSTTWLRRYWSFAGHRVRGMLAPSPVISSLYEDFRTGPWWDKEKRRKKGGFKHHQHYPRLSNMEKAMDKVTGGPWREKAHDRKQWKFLENQWALSCEGDSGRLMAQPPVELLTRLGLTAYGDDPCAAQALTISTTLEKQGKHLPQSFVTRPSPTACTEFIDTRPGATTTTRCQAAERDSAEERPGRRKVNPVAFHHGTTMPVTYYPTRTYHANIARDDDSTSLIGMPSNALLTTAGITGLLAFDLPFPPDQVPGWYDILLDNVMFLQDRGGSIRDIGAAFWAEVRSYRDPRFEDENELLLNGFFHALHANRGIAAQPQDPATVRMGPPSQAELAHTVSHAIRVIRDRWLWKVCPEAMKNLYSEQQLAQHGIVPAVATPARYWEEEIERRQLSRSRSPQRRHRQSQQGPEGPEEDEVEGHSLVQKRKSEATTEVTDTRRRRRSAPWKEKVLRDLKLMGSDRARARAHRQLLGYLAGHHGPQVADFAEAIVNTLWDRLDQCDLPQQTPDLPDLHTWTADTASALVALWDQQQNREAAQGATSTQGVVPTTVETRGSGVAGEAGITLDPPSELPFGIFHAAYVWPDGTWNTRGELLRMGRGDLVHANGEHTEPDGHEGDGDDASLMQGESRARPTWTMLMETLQVWIEHGMDETALLDMVVGLETRRENEEYMEWVKGPLNTVRLTCEDTRRGTADQTLLDPLSWQWVLDVESSLWRSFGNRGRDPREGREPGGGGDDDRVHLMERGRKGDGSYRRRRTHREARTPRGERYRRREVVTESVRSLLPRDDRHSRRDAGLCAGEPRTKTSARAAGASHGNHTAGDSPRPVPTQATSTHSGAGSSTDRPRRPPSLHAQLNREQACDLWRYLLGLDRHSWPNGLAVVGSGHAFVPQQTQDRIMDAFRTMSEPNRLLLTVTFVEMLRYLMAEVSNLMYQGSLLGRVASGEVVEVTLDPSEEEPDAEHDEAGLMQRFMVGGGRGDDDRWARDLARMQREMGGQAKSRRNANIRRVRRALPACEPWSDAEGRREMLRALLIAMYEEDAGEGVADELWLAGWANELEHFLPGCAFNLEVVPMEAPVVLDSDSCPLEAVPADPCQPDVDDPELVAARFEEAAFRQQETNLLQQQAAEFQKWERDLVRNEMDKTKPQKRQRTCCMVDVEAASSSGDKPRIGHRFSLMVPDDGQAVTLTVRAQMVPAPEEVSTDEMPSPAGVPSSAKAECSTAPRAMEAMEFADFQAIYQQWHTGELTLDQIQEQHGSEVAELIATHDMVAAMNEDTEAMLRAGRVDEGPTRDGALRGQPEGVGIESHGNSEATTLPLPPPLDKPQNEDDRTQMEQSSDDDREYSPEVNMDNEKYLLAHPEIRDMISVFVHQVLEYKPDNILRFAGDFFTRDDLYACVKKKTEE
ncbi:Pol, partial [Symbiodinium sp. CCMP2592]